MFNFFKFHIQYARRKKNCHSPQRPKYKIQQRKAASSSTGRVWGEKIALRDEATRQTSGNWTQDDARPRTHSDADDADVAWGPLYRRKDDEDFQGAGRFSNRLLPHAILPGVRLHRIPRA